MIKSKLSGEKIKIRNFLARSRVTAHCATDIAPCKVLMKCHLRAKLYLFEPTAKGIVKNSSGTKKHILEVVFKERDRVWVRNYKSGQNGLRVKYLETLVKQYTE